MYCSFPFDFFSGLKFATTTSIFIKAKDVQKPTSTVMEDFPFVPVKIGIAPSHLAVSADDLTLAVCIMKNSNAYALMYDIRSFAAKVIRIIISKSHSNMQIKMRVRCNKAGILLGTSISNKRRKEKEKKEIIYPDSRFPTCN